MSFCFRLGAVGRYCATKDKIRLSSLHFCWRASFLSSNLVFESVVIIYNQSFRISSVDKFCSKCEILILNSFSSCSEKSRCFALDGFSFSITPLSIIKTLRARTGRILRFCRVKDSRIAAWRNIFTTRNANCDIGFKQILGSISLLNFWFARLRSPDFTGKQQ